MKNIWIYIVVLLTNSISLYGQKSIAYKAAEHWQKNQWKANWITQAFGSKYDYGVHRFRKVFEVNAVPNTFVINVSADPRYELFVNGARVCRGPARGSLYSWYYETIDIAPFLKEGKNLIAATVWNYGEWSPGAQISLHTALIVQGESDAESIVNTDNTWKTYPDKSFSPSLAYLQDVGPGDIITGKDYPWNWNKIDFSDSTWKDAVVKERGQPIGTGTQYLRALTPRNIPLMKEGDEKALTIRRSTGMETDNNFINKQPLIIPPRAKVSILLDQGYLTNSYPSLSVSKGDESKIAVTYAEGMYMDDHNKGNRNEIEGKHIKGFVDIFYPEGGNNRIYSPLWFRTYRYIQLDIETKEKELIINSVEGQYTGYPFEENGYFYCNDHTMHDIWNVGWRTALLCAGETYYDCPYYEQLQYTGDTRIQGLISLYVSGDDRLMRKAIKDIASSITPEGILLSRYPARYNQIIPPFSLYWINMLHDYWMYRNDEAFIKSQLSVLKNILDWFENKINPETGMLGPLPHWNFVDWPNDWSWSDTSPVGGVPAGAITGGSAILTLQLAYSLSDAIELLEYFNEKALSAKYTQLKQTICDATVKRCFDVQRNLMADDIHHTSYSQHASIMGILSDAISKDRQKIVFENLNSDNSLIQTTVYYRFYLFQAMKKVGLADSYISSLDLWKDMLSNGLTTFAEQPEPSRSDCHAWSASPNYDFLATVCGIMPDSPGFKTIKIEPHLGNLTEVKGRVPHPAGNINVELKKKSGKITGTIFLPEKLLGIYKDKGRIIELKSGINEIK
jgi:hypothetical protein